MNIFENLIEELKEENLLEETVVETGNTSKDSSSAAADLSSESTNGNSSDKNVIDKITVESDIEDNSENSSEDAANISVEEESLSEEDTDQSESLNQDSSSENENTEKDNSTDKTKEKEFFKQRAVDEVTGLQMVEHVLSGIEREQQKNVTASYNDIRVNQALHNFLKIEDVKSPEHAQAEFHLMQETEDWYSSLSRRDRNIAVAQFRRFCEQTKPSLSARALMSLARFYRNSPYSESVRSKFDLIITRLFTKESENNKREILFEKEEIVKHLKELYADWASIPLYSLQDDDSEILLSILQFQEFIDEVEKVNTFEELVKSDFFKRVKVFKEKTSEDFFSPQLVASAIECNVIVGNKYVELIEREKSFQNLEEKYGVLHDESISEATSKTLELVELLKEKTPAEEKLESPAEKLNEQIIQKQSKTNYENSKKAGKQFSSKQTEKAKGIFGINKWLLIGAFLVLTLAIVFHFTQWSSLPNNDDYVPAGVVKVNIENSFLNDHIHEARISKNTFFAIAKPSWNQMQDGEKETFLRKIRSLGEDKSFKNVMILDEKGNVVASANENKIEPNLK